MGRFILLLCLSASLPVWGEPVIVGLPEPGRVPYFWRDDSGSFHGSYVELLKTLAAKVGFEVEFYMVPQARLIVEFNAGKIGLEPGIAPAWRPSAAERANSRFTIPFTTMQDVLIFKPGKVLPPVTSIPGLTALNGLRVAQVRGFYRPPGFVVEEFADEYTIARLIHLGELDVGLINASVAAWFKTQNQFHYEISAPYASTPVALRFSAGNEELVEPTNRALEELKASGQLQKLLLSW